MTTGTANLSLVESDAGQTAEQSVDPVRAIVRDELRRFFDARIAPALSIMVDQWSSADTRDSQMFDFLLNLGRRDAIEIPDAGLWIRARGARFDAGFWADHWHRSAGRMGHPAGPVSRYTVATACGQMLEVDVPGWERRLTKEPGGRSRYNRRLQSAKAPKTGTFCADCLAISHAERSAS